MLSALSDSTSQSPMTLCAASPRPGMSTPLTKVNASPKRSVLRRLLCPGSPDVHDDWFINRLFDDDADDRNAPEENVQCEVEDSPRRVREVPVENIESSTLCTGAKTPLRKSGSSAHHIVHSGFQTPLFPQCKNIPPGRLSDEKYQFLLKTLQGELRMEFVAIITKKESPAMGREYSIDVAQRLVEGSDSADEDVHEADQANFRQISEDLFICGQVVIHDAQYHKLLEENCITDVINVAAVSRPSFTDITTRGCKRRRLSLPSEYHAHPPRSSEGNPESTSDTGDKTLQVEKRKISYHQMECVDDDNYPILRLDYDFFADKIDGIRSSNPDAKIIVHCVAGMNRSSCLCIAYLIDRNGLDIRSAIRRVRGLNETYISNQRQLLLRQESATANSASVTCQKAAQIPIGCDILSNHGFRKELIQFCANRFPSSLITLCEDE